jgi:hypothetical protein
MFGHDSLPSRIWSFGGPTGPPSENLPLVREQLRLANRYRNDLIEVELRRREQCNEATHRRHPALAAAEGDADALVRRIEETVETARAENRRERKRTADAKSLRALLKPLKDQLREVRQRVREERAAAKADPSLREELSAVNEAASGRRRGLRAACGLYWGSYLQVEQDVQRACREPEPRFRRFTGEGKLAVQLQKGLSVGDLLGGQDPRLRLSLGPGKYHTLRFRIGSAGAGSRDPVFAALTINLHRELPRSALVKWCFLTVRRVGTDEEWRAQLVLARGEGWARDDDAKDGVCAVDLGYRRMPDGLLRVASWVGQDGGSGELLLPPRLMWAFSKADELRSLRDRLFNGARDTLRAWLSGSSPGSFLGELADWLEAEVARDARDGKDDLSRRRRSDAATLRLAVRTWTPPREVPDWLRERTTSLHCWRSAARLAALVLRWQGRFPDRTPATTTAGPRSRPLPPVRPYPDGQRILDALEVWRRTNKHLYQWESRLRLKATRRRDDLYRVFSRDLARRYRTAVTEDINWRDIKASPDVTTLSENVLPAGVRYAAHWSACGTLARFLREAVADPQTGDPAWSTQRCHDCGKREVFDKASELVHTCSHCGARWDQDRNAALVLLAVFLGRLPPLPREAA